MLINLRNALMAGKRLPYDAEVEYLESTGTQWIDTGVATSATAKIETKFLLHNIYTQAVYGNRIDGTNGVFWGTGATGIVYCNDGITPVSPEFSSVAETTYEVVQQGNNIVINGENCTTTGASDNAQTMFLFARREAGSASRIINGRIFYHRIYDANGVLVRDFIPVRKGTVGYLYDRVSGNLFGNAGTGDFVLGPDVVPVEYIESHGTEWIDTGVVPGGKIINAEVAFKLLMLNGSVSGIIGSNVNDGRDNFQFTCYRGEWRLKLNNYASYNGAIDTDKHILKLNTSQGTFLDSLQLVTSQYTINAGNTQNIYLGACNYNGTTTPSSDVYRLIGKLYYAKIYDNSNPVRSFRPVRVGTDATSWEGAMMDVLTRRIYRNAGTGAFAYGNDLKYPIPAS